MATQGTTEHFVPSTGGSVQAHKVFTIRQAFPSNRSPFLHVGPTYPNTSHRDLPLVVQFMSLLPDGES